MDWTTGAQYTYLCMGNYVLLVSVLISSYLSFVGKHFLMDFTYWWWLLPFCCRRDQYDNALIML
jgi:hypothetical protein